MHDLIPLDPAPAGSLTTAEIDATMAYAEAEKALATRAAYARLARLRRLVRLQGRHSPAGARRHRRRLPLRASLTAAARPRTIGRRAAAIGYHHKMAGHEPPTNAEGVKAVLRGIRRTIGSAKQGKAPATADLIEQMLALCPDTHDRQAGPRAAGLGFAGAFRRSELCALEVADLTEVPDGLRVLIRAQQEATRKGRGRRSRSPAATGCARSRRCRRGWRRRRSAPARCSAPWRWAEGCRTRPWRTTARRGS